jgi:hypothetical protein
MNRRDNPRDDPEGPEENDEEMRQDPSRSHPESGHHGAGDEGMTNQQYHELAVGMATIRSLAENNALSTQRLEIRLMGSDDNPESGIIASHSRRIRNLEEYKIKIIAYATVAAVLIQILGKRLMDLVGLK